MKPKRKPGVTFPEPRMGVFAHPNGPGSSLRFSTYLHILKKQGTSTEALDEFKSDKAKYGSTCRTHGALEDPIVGLIGSGPEARVAFACPWCSGPEILEAWEKEGLRS